MDWRWRFYAVGGRFDRRKFWYAVGLLLAGCSIILLLMAVMRLRPLLEQMATTRASNTVTRIVSDAVDEAIDNGDIQYAELVTFEKDQEGHITALHSNMAAFNRLQSSILDLVVQRVDETASRDLSIPIGNLTGSALLAGRGPRIQVRMETMGSSSARFENEFIAAGINQTKHQIILQIDVYITILLPGVTTATKVSNAITVAETVIVGMVPQTYTYFGSEPSSYADDTKNYVLNKG